MVKQMFEALTAGIMPAIVWAAVGYAVAKAKGEETFEPLKFAKTLVIGVILAAAGQGLGVDAATLEGMSVIGFLTAIVDKVAGLFLSKKK